MNNHIAMLYMKAMTEGKLFEKEKRKNIVRSYPLKKTCFAKDKAQSYTVFFKFETLLHSK